MLGIGKKLRAKDTRLLATVTFHYAAHRIEFLADVLRNFAAFPVARRVIVIFTNTSKPDEQAQVRAVFRQLGLKEGRDVRLEVKSDLLDPFHLAWAHKPIIRKFLARKSDFTHFVYVEDDERFSFENFSYFLDAREILRPFGLLPGFLRVEWNKTLHRYAHTDSTAPTDLSKNPFVPFRNWRFTAVDFPHDGCYVLDRELAREYAGSLSFDLNKSVERSTWGICERASMGLTFEAVPAPFKHRMVIPVSRRSPGVIPQCAWIFHLPNNYADNPRSPFGKIPMDKLLVNDFDAARAVAGPVARRRRPRWLASRNVT